MSDAKAAVMEELDAVSDDLDDEMQIVNNLYHRMRLKLSRESAAEDGTYSTNEVREFFARKRTGILQ